MLLIGPHNSLPNGRWDVGDWDLIGMQYNVEGVLMVSFSSSTWCRRMSTLWMMTERNGTNWNMPCHREMKRWRQWVYSKSDFADQSGWVRRKRLNHWVFVLCLQRKKRWVIWIRASVRYLKNYKNHFVWGWMTRWGSWMSSKTIFLCLLSVECMWNWSVICVYVIVILCA